MLRRITAALAALTMVFGAAAFLPEGTVRTFSQSAAADEVFGDYEYKVMDNGTIVINKYKGDAAELVIPDNINGIPVTRIGGMAFSEKKSLESITFPDSITYIGGWAFWLCSGLKNVTLPKGLTVIEEYTFNGCTGLETIELPQTMRYLNKGAFYNCPSMTDIVLPDGLFKIGESAFSNCTGLQEIDIPDSVTQFGPNAFSACKGLKRVKLSSSVKHLPYCAFYGCESLPSIEVPYGVQTIGADCFNYCTSLTDVSLPESLICIANYAFNNDTMLKTMAFPESIVIYGTRPVGFTDANGKRSDFTLQCYSGSMGEKYATDNNLNKEYITHDISNVEVELDYNTFIYDGSEKKPSIVSIKDRDRVLYSGYDYNYTFENNVEVGTATMLVNGAGNYSGTKRVDFEIKDPHDLSGNVCGENLIWELSSDGTFSVRGTGKMYDFEAAGAPWYPDRKNIKKIVISDDVTSIGSYAFSDCHNAVSVELPESIEVIGDYAFCDDISLEDITIPHTLKSLGVLAFANTKWLDNKRTEASPVIVNDMLIDGKNCTGDVVVPDGVTQICGYAFSKNDAITSMTLPDGVNNIGCLAFEKCTALEYIKIPDSVSFIYSDSFDGCSEDLSICGYNGSYAAMYASNHGIDFKPIVTDISDYEVVLPQTVYEYEGKSIEPAVTVKLDNIRLKRDIDYTVEYQNNDKAGTATVVVTGKGDYSGTAKADFTIKNKGETQNSVKGDINSDGIVNVSDISKAAAHVKAKLSLEGTQLDSADVNGDGIVNVSDISMIAAHVKGIKELK